MRRVSNRLLVVQSAGNHSTDACAWAYARTNPNDGILVVGGINETGEVAPSYDNRPVGQLEPGSNGGPCVEAWAPSQHIWSTWPTDPYKQVLSGTSMAAPFVSGLAMRYGSPYSTTPVEREHFIRAKRFATGFTDNTVPGYSAPILVPSNSQPPTYPIPSKLYIADVQPTTTLPGTSKWAVSDGAYLTGVWNSGSTNGDITLAVGLHTLTSIRISPERYPYTGTVTHQIYADNNPMPIATYSGYDSILEPIALSLNNVMASYVRIVSSADSSWIAFREIEVYGY